MGWFDILLRRPPLTRDWDALEVGRVRLEGSVRALELLTDPVEGRRCVAMEYRAWPPSTTLGVDGAAVSSARAFQVVATQAVEFLLEAGGTSILVRPQSGEDVGERHAALDAKYGFNLRTEVQCVVPGDVVRVEGRVSYVSPAGGSPLRSDPYRAVVDATRFQIV